MLNSPTKFGIGEYGYDAEEQPTHPLEFREQHFNGRGGIIWGLPEQPTDEYVEWMRQAVRAVYVALCAQAGVDPGFVENTDQGSSDDAAWG